MIRPKIEAKNSLLSLTKNCEILIKQNHKEPLNLSLHNENKHSFLNHLLILVSIVTG